MRKKPLQKVGVRVGLAFGGARSAYEHDDRDQGDSVAHAGTKQLHNIHSTIGFKSRLMHKIHEPDTSDDYKDEDDRPEWFAVEHGCLLGRLCAMVHREV